MRLESQVSCLEIWSNLGCFLPDPFMYYCWQGDIEKQRNVLSQEKQKYVTFIEYEYQLIILQVLLLPSRALQAGTIRCKLHLM